MHALPWWRMAESGRVRMAIGRMHHAYAPAAVTTNFSGLPEGVGSFTKDHRMSIGPELSFV
jgi:hypothetical protein